MAIREVVGKDYRTARSIYERWAATQRFPKSFKRWLRENVGTKPKKYNSVKEAEDAEA